MWLVLSITYHTVINSYSKSKSYKLSPHKHNSASFCRNKSLFLIFSLRVQECKMLHFVFVDDDDDEDDDVDDDDWDD